MASENLQRAIALIEVNQLFEAMPLLNEAISAQPECVAAYLQRAKLRRRLGDNEGAITDYTQVIKLTPSASVYLARALVWLTMGQVKGAVTDSRAAVKLDPSLASGHRLLGKSLGILGDGPGAISAYKQAARCYLDGKDKENAQACLDAIGPLQKLPPYDYAQAPWAAGAGGVAGSQGLDLAQPTSREATPEEFVRRVRLKYEAGEYGAAMADLNWLLGVEATFAPALCLRGLIQAQLGRRELAVADLAQAKALCPEDPEVRFARGQMRLIFKDADGAIEEFSALISESAETPDARYFVQRGDAYRLREDTESAFKDYSNALAIDTENAQLYELRAEMQKEMSAVEGAIADYKRAATLWLDKGNWPRHQRVVEAVRSLRNQKVLQSSSTGSSSKSTAVPIKSYENHLPVVEVLLDGVATFDIVVDRNATHSIVTKQMATQLNLDMVSYRYVYLADGTPMELPIGRLRSVVVGRVVITDVYVAIAPDKATAVLGKDCFSLYSIRISGNEMMFVRR
ncbi:MAG: tetratricopeptide repeat protein [Cyanobacteria bacterium P01_F01_bin.53]